MKVLHRRCAGLDVHKEVVVACARLLAKRKASYELKRFAATTQGLSELADWLEQLGVTHVAMEATGVYWKPVWHLLEGRFALLLANPQHIRNVPGRKSDINDATWIADLMAHGLIEASFVPERPIRELRDLTRTRRQLVREIVQHCNRIAKVLEDANIKLDSVISDLMGTSGRNILKAMIAGETDPAKLAALGSTRLKCTQADLIAALDGRLTAHHRFLLAQHLALVEQLEATVAEFDSAIEAAIAPFREPIERLKHAPGLKGVAAPALIAEIGLDMTRFASAGHILSWARLVPRLDESAGKKRSTRVKNGGAWLKPLLVQCAWAAIRKKGSYLQGLFRRLRARRGDKTAIVAVAASILTAVYHMLRNATPYHDPGPDGFQARDRAKLATSLTRRLRTLGYHVDIKAAA
jgi:transposase